MSKRPINERPINGEGLQFINYKLQSFTIYYSPGFQIVHPQIVHDCQIVHFFRKIYETGKKSFWLARQNLLIQLVIFFVRNDKGVNFVYIFDSKTPQKTSSQLDNNDFTKFWTTLKLCTTSKLCTFFGNAKCTI